jgi:hypothetical protein
VRGTQADVDIPGTDVEFAWTTQAVHVVSVPAGMIGGAGSTASPHVVPDASVVIPTIHSCDDDNEEFYRETETPEH